MCEHCKLLANFYSKHTPVCVVLITQQITSTFDKFQFMVNEWKFVIITLSQTWLKNHKHLLEYVNFPGNKFSNRNRDEERGASVGVYINDCITYNIRNDIISLDHSLEHLWVEEKSKNKKLPCLILVPKMLGKLNVLSKFMQFYLRPKRFGAVPYSWQGILTLTYYPVQRLVICTNKMPHTYQRISHS